MNESGCCTSLCHQHLHCMTVLVSFNHAWGIIFHDRLKEMFWPKAGLTRDVLNACES